MADFLLDIAGLSVSFGHGKNQVKALNKVALQVPKGSAVGLVGESGSGKTTLARCVLGLQSGKYERLHYAGRAISDWLHKDAQGYRSRLQYVFQDPFSSLNPRLSVGRAIGEVLKIRRGMNPKECRDEVGRLLVEVGLDPEYADRFPHEFSGGQRQRIGIARAIAVDPELIIADEPVSALDVSVQVQILNLLKDLGQSRGLSYLFIAHDLAVVRYMCDRVYVLQHGQMVESGEAGQVLGAAQHPYTKRLLAAVPKLA